MSEPSYDAITLGGGPGKRVAASVVAGATGCKLLRKAEVCLRFQVAQFSQPSGGRFPADEDSRWIRFLMAAGLCLLLMLTACRTPAPWPPVDTTQAGWRVLNGQAIWLPRKGDKEVAGDLLVALGPRGDCLVQFSKTPFPLVTARATDRGWQMEFGAGARRYGGPGEPPLRFVWFPLADALRGGPVAAPWRAEHSAPDHWRLTDARTGERLEVWISP